MICRSVFVFISIFLFTSVAHASLLIQGEFTGSDFDGGTIDSLNGSFTAEFDNSVLTGVGLEMFEEMSILTSFNFSNNPLGATTFDTSNVAISLYFVDGVFDALIIGGTESTANSVGAGTDDFSVIYTVLGAPILFSYSTITDSAIYAADSITGNLTLSNTPVSQVPNPATLTLMVFGLLMLVAKRRAK